jgi:hypothetical protein
MKHLIKDAYDLHVHSGPDLLPRRMNDIEMAQRIIASGMAGYAMKSHFFCTAERAKLINEMFPGCDGIGAVALNNAVGGINPIAVEMAGRSGAKIVWMPTCDSAHERKLVFGGNPHKKLPYWATLAIQLREEGVVLEELTVLDENDKLTKKTLDVIDVIVKHNMILATGHLSQHEVFILLKEAAQRGVKRMVITHADYPGTYYSIDEQKELVKHGAYIEHCYTTWATQKVTFEETVDQIKAIGPDHVILSTDLGQKTAVYPDEGLLAFAEKLFNSGISEDDIRKMVVTNNRYLLNK